MKDIAGPFMPPNHGICSPVNKHAELGVAKPLGSRVTFQRRLGGLRERCRRGGDQNYSESALHVSGRVSRAGTLANFLVAGLFSSPGATTNGLPFIRMRICICHAPLTRGINRGNVVRNIFLFLSQNQKLRRFMETSPAARRFSHRFVAGDTLEEALAACQSVNDDGLTVT